MPAGHVHGSFNVPVSGSSYATRAGFILDPEERIVIHATDEAEALEAARGLRAVGFIELAGYVTEAPATDVVEPVGLDELERLLEEGEVQVLDVREKSERDEGYIPGSLHIPFRLLRDFGPDGVDAAEAGRDDLRVRDARRHRGERPRSSRCRRKTGSERRRERLARRDRVVPPVRL